MSAVTRLSSTFGGNKGGGKGGEGGGGGDEASSRLQIQILQPNLLPDLTKLMITLRKKAYWLPA